MWNFHQRVAPSKGIQDSLGFWIPYHGFRISGTIFRILYQWKLDSAFQSSAGFRIPWQYSVIQSPGFRTPQAKISCILDSASKIFSDSGIRISLNRNVGSRHPLETLKTLNPKTDQHQFSPNNINILSKNKVMRINMMITKEKYFDLVSVPCKAAHLGFLH